MWIFARSITWKAWPSKNHQSRTWIQTTNLTEGEIHGRPRWHLHLPRWKIPAMFCTPKTSSGNHLQGIRWFLMVKTCWQLPPQYQKKEGEEYSSAPSKNALYHIPEKKCVYYSKHHIWRSPFWVCRQCILINSLSRFPPIIPSPHLENDFLMVASFGPLCQLMDPRCFVRS